jgi:hypothetical protein
MAATIECRSNPEDRYRHEGVQEGKKDEQDS